MTERGSIQEFWWQPYNDMAGREESIWEVWSSGICEHGELKKSQCWEVRRGSYMWYSEQRLSARKGAIYVSMTNRRVDARSASEVGICEIAGRRRQSKECWRWNM
jgi:hypothetical protein